MPTFTKYFLRGVLVLLPIVVTIYLVYFVGKSLEPAFSWLGGILNKDAAEWMKMILGVAVSLVLIVSVGMVATNFLGARIVAAIEHVFDRLPLIRMLHGAVKDVLGAFVGDKKSFDRPVMVDMSADGTIRVVGFLTRDDLSFLGTDGDVAVYLPQSYNFAGNLIVVPAARVHPIDAPSSDVMTFLVSGGVSAHAKDAKKSTEPEALP